MWKVGDQRSIARTFTQSDIDAFAALTGDDQPIHTDAAFAAGTRFGGTLVHGFFTASMFSTVLGKHIPGEGMVIISTDPIFWRKPVRPGDTITFTGEITKLADGGLMKVHLTATNAAGDIVCETSVTGKYRPVQA